VKIGKVLVVINRVKDGAESVARQLKEILDREKIAQEWVETLPASRATSKRLNDLRDCRADLALVCGGDGTMLQTAHRLKGSGVPLLGINIGYLGFITSFEKRQLKSSVRRVLKGEYQITERLTLDVRVLAGRKVASGWALNDVLISRGANPHLISVAGKVGGKPLTQYRCDGLLVATPTGSTAYTLAAGGPIISPECDVLVVTPICPQALTSRSVVVGRDRVIEMELTELSGDGEVQADGVALGSVKSGQRIEVEASDVTVPIAFLPEVDFFDALTSKLHWHGQGISTPQYNRT
jgi:NAD+ kinase